MRGRNFDITDSVLCTDTFINRTFNVFFRNLGLYHCFSCKRSVYTFCGTCARQLKFFPSTCFICEKYSVDGATHISCTSGPLTFTTILSLFSYTKLAKKLFLAYKFNLLFQYQRVIEKLLQEYVRLDPFLFFRHFHIDSSAHVAVVPVPMTHRKEHERGFSPAKELAIMFGRELKKRYSCNVRLFPTLLVKKQETVAQSRKKRTERLLSLQYAYEYSPQDCADLCQYKPTHIILVDDVITTGATANAVFEAMLKNEQMKELLQKTERILFSFAKA